MSLLIYAGLLYLLGISIVLMIKPALMFSEKGIWKEFGMGRPSSTYTWLPFWLFSMIWAILSYLIVLLIASHTGLAGVHTPTDLPVTTETLDPEYVSRTSRSSHSVSGHSVSGHSVSGHSVSGHSVSKKKMAPSDMKEGYYMLDMNETGKRGVPKYIYVGPEAPHMIYHQLDASD
jgi:hypothetical protein